MKLLKYTAVLSTLFVYSGDLKCSSCLDLDTLDPQEKKEIVRGIYTPRNIVLAAQQIAKDVTELLEQKGITYWAAYGTVLGALRHNGEDGKKTGGMIPWDDDIDICIHEKDMGTIRDRPFRAELKKLGYAVVKHPEVGLQIQSTTRILNPKTNQEVAPIVDIFMVKATCDGTKYEFYPAELNKLWPKAWFWKNQVDHLTRVNFGEFALWMPSNPEEYLTRQYGADWKTRAHYYFSHLSKFEGYKKWTLTGTDLDPAQPTGPLKNRLGKNITPVEPIAPIRENFTEHNQAYWDQFYAKTNLARDPSTFCKYIIQKGILRKGATLLDIGCGNGRDTFAFRKASIAAFGLDASQSAVATNIAYAHKQGIEETIFRAVDVCSAQEMKDYTEYDAIYARFFVHAITEQQQAVFMQYLAHLNPNTKVLLEFRTDKDHMFQLSTKVGSREGKTDHYRRFINFERFCKDLEGLGYKLIEAYEQGNLSVTFKEDPKLGRIEDNPILGRIIATKIGK